MFLFIKLSFTAEYITPTPRTKKSDWYHGTLERIPSIQTLKNFSDNDGSFLVRYSIHSGYVLTMLYLLQDYHFVIQKQVKTILCSFVNLFDQNIL